MTKVLAVIHHVDDATSARNARLAAEAGCDGVAFIQMEGRDEEIDIPAMSAKAAYPGLLVVANRLSSLAHEAIARDVGLGLDGSWSDDLLVTSRGATPAAGQVREALSAARAVRPDYLFFGSVAFKGQQRDPDPAEAARVAAREPWIVTTSGPGTGLAPDRGKLLAMQLAAGHERMAVASGITPSNAASLAPLVSWVLVATGISKSFHELDEDLTHAIVRACRAA